MNLPEWWVTASGVFFVLGAVCMAVGTVVSCVALWVLLELRTQIGRLTDRVDEIGEKVNNVAATVQTVTSEVGTRATGITRMVDDAAGGAMDVVERFAPFFLGIAAVLKLFTMIGLNRRKRA